MTDQLKQRLDALRAIAPRLNAATDEASNIVKSVEKVLTDELGIGVSAESLPLEIEPGEDTEDGEGFFEYLAYGRVGGTYRIHVLVSRERRSEDIADVWDVVSQQPIPWPSCSREQKLRAFEQLPYLLDLLLSKAEGLMATAEKTAATVKELTGGK